MRSRSLRKIAASFPNQKSPNLCPSVSSHQKIISKYCKLNTKFRIKVNNVAASLEQNNDQHNHPKNFCWKTICFPKTSVASLASNGPISWIHPILVKNNEDFKNIIVTTPCNFSIWSKETKVSQAQLRTSTFSDFFNECHNLSCK